MDATPKTTDPVRLGTNRRIQMMDTAWPRSQMAVVVLQVEVQAVVEVEVRKPVVVQAIQPAIHRGIPVAMAAAILRVVKM